MQTENNMTETAGNLLIHESPENHHCGPSRATDHAHASDQRARKQMMSHCSKLESLWVDQVLSLPCRRTEDDVIEMAGIPLTVIAL
jgi:hypothetical protein